MLMFHENKSCIGSRYSSGWRAKVVPSADEAAELITKYVTSSCIWSRGIRLKANFRMADWLGLDFDGGMPLNEAQRLFKPYLHVLGTTRNHQKEKNGRVDDRFRVFLRFGRRCLDADDYEQTVRKWVDQYGADEQCVDAARLFFPCKNIVTVQSVGKVIIAEDATELKKKRAQYARKHHAQLKKWYSKTKVMPGWISSVLRYGCAEGERNNTAYRIACDLKTIGYLDSDVVSIIMSSALPNGCEPFGEAECRTTVSSAYRHTREESR